MSHQSEKRSRMQKSELEVALYRNWIKLLPLVGEVTVRQLFLYKDNLPYSKRALVEAVRDLKQTEG